LPRSSAPDAPGSKHTAMLTQFRPTPQPEPGYFYTALCTFHSAPCFNGQQRAGAKGCHSNSHHSGAQALSLPHARMSSASWLGPGQPNQPQGRRPSSGASPYQGGTTPGKAGAAPHAMPPPCRCVCSQQAGCSTASQVHCQTCPKQETYPAQRTTQCTARGGACCCWTWAQRAAPLPPSSTPCERH